jgi:hypothetical protein
MEVETAGSHSTTSAYKKLGIVAVQQPYRLSEPSKSVASNNVFYWVTKQH